jgi:hypothetical protein
VETIETKLKVIWAMTDRGTSSYRTRVGVAWENADGSLSARLDAIPMSGRLEVRDWVARVDEPAGEKPEAVAAGRAP